jgi:membrane protease subunit (stomatin/prohibitin family)
MKERLQEEFSQIGIKVEGLKVEIENMVEVNETKEAINKRYDRCFIKNITRAARVLNFQYKTASKWFLSYG